MAETSNIAWTTSTFNPWIGCTKIGPGCDHCYAEAQDGRKRWGGVTHWGHGVPRHHTSVSYWKQPLTWDKKQREIMERWLMGGLAIYPPDPHRVFCASLADVFDNEVPTQWRIELFALIHKTPSLSWLLVTKRIGNVHSMMHIMGHQIPDNVRLMITVVNQEEADRDIPKLLALPCKNGISYEPALGPVNFGPYLSRDKIFAMLPGFKDPMGGVQWVIIGGESTQGGAQARPFNVEWARSTIVQCKVAGVPVFMKQLGSNHDAYLGPCGEKRDRAGADPDEWPIDLNVREFP